VTEVDRKGAARRAAFDRRKLAKSTADEARAQRNLLAVLSRWPGAPLAGYMPIRTEIDPLPVMAAWSGHVGVPVIQGAGLPLEFHSWTPGCAMTDGPFGAQVPADAHAITPRLLIVPLVAFTRQGGRLGYGGGFYDRTLQMLRAANPATRAVGFAFAAQEADDLPLEPTDQPLDAIATERDVLDFGLV
jgi:5-formyltetrahydrofolate cyclo-ligase